MTRPFRLLHVLLLSLALGAGLLSGCAHDPDRGKPWKKGTTKWYESDMDSSERAFFLGGFFNNGR